VKSRAGCVTGGYSALKALLQRGQRFAGGLSTSGGTRDIVVNGAGLVAAEAADASEIFGDRDSGDEIGVRARCAAACRGSNRGAHGSKVEGESAFGVRRGGNDFIQKHGLIAGRRSGRRTTQSSEGGGKAIAVGRAVGHGRGSDGAHGDSGSGFIGRDARIQETGYSDRRDDQDNGYDNEQLDQGETALSAEPEFRIPTCVLGEHDRNNFPLEAS